MTYPPDTPPDWAAKAQKNRRWARVVWPWDKLDAEWKAREAAGAATTSAGGMAALHLLWLVLSPHVETSGRYLVPFSPPFAAFLSSLILVTLAVSQHNRPKAWKAWLMLAWTTTGLLGLTVFVYGYPGLPLLLGIMLVTIAFLGVRGTLRLKAIHEGRYQPVAAT
jgi:TctA family transporter